ncbi:MAG: bifunctional UDP-N-acetylglucosamine diphosphorylase/glucosamine-1-phosphate N-acetyltransferase GlmU [Terriglobales bacterium]
MAKTKHDTHAPRTAIAILAAGKGTRLKSKHPKVLHEVGGKPLLAHVIAAATKVVPANDVYAIIGHEADRVRNAAASSGIGFVLQAEQHGTGHALMVARQALAPYNLVIVLYGDAPLITSETIKKLRDFHISKKAVMTVLTAEVENPTGYGRIVRKKSGSDDIRAIVEQKHLSAAQAKIHEINSGFYAFDAQPLFTHIDKLSTNNHHGEFYLTDMAAILGKSGQRVVAVQADNPHEVLGGNTRAELSEIDQHMRMAKCRQLMADGVTIFYPETCVIDSDVQIGADTVVEPFVQLRGSTTIGSDTRVGSYSVIINCEIGDQVLIQTSCVLEHSAIRARASMGPYSHLRPGCEICEEAHVGNFVELKKSRLGKGSKANHLTYLGDSEIGERVNVGAGTITCNYDGVNKHKTIIEDGVFVGSDSILIAPVRIGKGAYVAAATTVTEDVPPDSLALGRARQIVKEGWAKEKREKAKAQKAK